MFKTSKSFESPRKGTLPEPMGVLKLKGEERYYEFFKVLTGKAIIKVSDKEFKSVNCSYYQIAEDEFVSSINCKEVNYYLHSFKQD